MKKALKFVLLIFCFVIAINIFTVNESKANVASTVEFSSSKSNFFVFVRVQENNRIYIYIYTNGGIFLSKFEEL